MNPELIVILGWGVHQSFGGGPRVSSEIFASSFRFVLSHAPRYWVGVHASL